MENNRIVLVGAGNMATSLAFALKDSGNTPVAVWSRTAESASMLGNRVGCPYTTDISSLPLADIVIISVVDSALQSVAHSVAQHYPSALLLHTAGSIPMSALHDAGAYEYGVLYPMQTMSRQNIVPLGNVSIFVEGCNDNVLQRISSLASSLSSKVIVATSRQRCILHVAAVFACNFPNALYTMVAELLEKNGLPFDSMLPLIDEAARKVHLMSPVDAQTGPAKRGDQNVMDTHKSMLDEELAGIYQAMSDYIMKRNN